MVCGAGILSLLCGAKDCKLGGMDILLLEYPPCSTCRRAHAWLESQGVTFACRHITEQRPTAAELAEWQRLSGLPLKRFFNTSGMKYRELALAARLPEMPEAEQLALLASDGMLVKRPLLVTPGGVAPGFREQEWRRLLGLV